MSKKSKIATAVLAVGLTGVLAGSGYVIGSNWNSIKAGFKGEMLFTQNQVQEKVDKAYKDGLGQGVIYQGIIDELTTNLSLVETNLVKITAERDQLQAALDSIQNSNNGLNLTIEELRGRIETLEQEKSELLNELDEIKSEHTIKLNELNAELARLRNQLSSSTDSQQGLASQVDQLNAQISTLQGDVAYYKDLLEQYRDENKVSATFIYDGATYAMQFIDKDGSVSSITNPADTEYIKFKGWSVDGQIVDISTYQCSEDTVFVAVVDRYYDATFIYEGETVEVVKVLKNDYATVSNIPANTAYKRLNGWKVNGVLFNLESYEITTNTTFVADVVYSYDVKFQSELKEIGTPQIVESGNYAEVPEEPTHDYYTFLYWSVDGTTKVDLTTYPITSDTTFIAVWQTEYQINYVMQDKVETRTLKAGEPLWFVEPSQTADSGITLDGWTDVQGSYKAVDFTNKLVDGDATYYAILRKTISGTKTVSIPVKQYGNEYVVDMSDTILNFKNETWAGCSQNCIVSVKFGSYSPTGQYGNTLFPTSSYRASYTFTDDFGWSSNNNGSLYKGTVKLRYLNGKMYVTVTSDSASAANITEINITLYSMSYYI